MRNVYKIGNFSESMFIKKSLGAAQLFILIASIFSLGHILSEGNLVSGEEPPSYLEFSFESPKQTTPNGGSLFSSQSAMISATQRAGPGYNVGGLKGTILVVKQNIDGMVDTSRLDLSAINGIEQLQGDKFQLIGENGQPLLETALTKNQFQALQTEAAKNGISITEKETFGESIFGEAISSGGWAHLLKGLSWSIAVVGVIQAIAPLLGADKTTTNALSVAAFAGIMTYQGLASLGPSGFNVITNPQNFFLGYAGAIGLGASDATVK